MQWQDSIYRAEPDIETRWFTAGNSKGERQKGKWCSSEKMMSACAYFYLDKPSSNLPALAAKEERIADLRDNGQFIGRQDV